MILAGSTKKEIYEKYIKNYDSIVFCCNATTGN